MSNIHTRKIRKSGNSYVLTIPPNILESLELSEGDSVQLTQKNNHVELSKKEPDIVDEEFLNLVDSIYEEHRETFKSLVDK